jgi:hypothetical protein
MMHIVNNMMKFLELNLFKLSNVISKYKKMVDSIGSKSKPLHSINIWTNNIDNEVNNPCPRINVANKINIEYYDLRSNFAIQSHHGSN